MVLLIAGHVDSAIATAKRFQAINKNSVTANMLLMLNDVKQGNYDKAEHVLKDATGQGFYGMFLPVLRAWIALGAGNTEKALNTLKAIQSNDTFSPFLHYHTALIKNQIGLTDEAEKEFSTMLKDNPYLSERMLIVLSNFYQRTHQPEKAEALYKKFIDQHNDVWFAAEDILHFVRLQPTSTSTIRNAAEGIAEAFYGTASILHSQYSIGDAHAYIRMALHLKPDFPDAQYLLGAFFEQEEWFSQAAESFTHIREDSLYGWKGRIQAARNRHRAGNTSTALSELEALAQIPPHSAAPHLHIADILRMEKRYEEATKEYSIALERTDTSKPRYWPRTVCTWHCLRPIQAVGQSRTRLSRRPRTGP